MMHFKSKCYNQRKLTTQLPLPTDIEWRGELNFKKDFANITKLIQKRNHEKFKLKPPASISTKRKPTMIYTDAGFQWMLQKGNVAFKIGNGRIHIWAVNSVPDIPYLKQYINFLELLAIYKSMYHTKSRKLNIHTDSRIAKKWAKTGRNRLDSFSYYHWLIKEGINALKPNFTSVSFSWVPRDANPTGIALEHYVKNI